MTNPAPQDWCIQNGASTSIWSIVCRYSSMSVSHLPALIVSHAEGRVSIVLLFRHHCPDDAISIRGMLW